MKKVVSSFLFLLFAFGAKAQPYLPIPVTGFNEDVVAETGTSALATTTREMDAESISNYVLCTKGFALQNSFTPPNIYGLPDSGLLVSPTRTFQMGPFNAGNAVYLFPSDTGNLNLVNPSRFTNLSLLTLATEGDATVKITFHYSDGSFQNATRNFTDWFGPVANPVFFGYGRVKRKDGPFSAGVDYEAAAGGNPKFSNIDFTMPCTKTLVSIGFKNTSISGPGSSRAFIFGVSGLEKKVIPKITATASDTVVCKGISINFVATPESQGTTPVYTWKVNGVVVGSNLPTFSSTTLQNQDIITCTLQSNAACAAPPIVVSNSIKVTIIPPKVPKVDLSVDDSTVCAGVQINFTATPVEPGTAPIFTWKVNGLVVGTDQPGYSSSTLQNQDVISCTMQSNATCASPATVVSNTIKVTISPLLTPTASISLDDSTVCEGKAVEFITNAKNAGSPPKYEWRLNGVVVGKDSSRYILLEPKTGDKVNCLVTSTESCKSLNSVATPTKTIEVFPIYNLNIEVPDPFLLDDSSKLILTSPPGGLLSGTGIENSRFYPKIAGPGSHTIQYSFPGNICSPSVSKSIVVLPCNLDPANVMTMNGDGLNDAWHIGDFDKNCILSASIEIFNRWGTLVFKSEDYKNDWFGKKDGEQLPTGCYFFTITYKTASSAERFKKNGVLTLAN